MTLGPFILWSREEIEKRRRHFGDRPILPALQSPRATEGIDQRIYDRAYWAAWGFPLPVEPLESHHPENKTIPGYTCAQCGKPWEIIPVDMTQPPAYWWAHPLNQVCYTEVPVCDCGYGEQE